LSDGKGTAVTRKANERVVLVTGASSGFGLAISNDLAGAGWRVYGASRRAEGEQSPEGVMQMRMDVDDDASIAAAVAAVLRREGRLDAVICNAGYGIAGAIEDTSTEEAQAQFNTNFFGTHRVTRAVLPHLRDRGRSNLIVIGSLAGLIGIPFQGIYSASKFALEGYCEALRMELRDSPVMVTLLEPGDFATGFTDKRVRVTSSGPGSRYESSFSLALKIITADELGSEGPTPVAQAVRETLACDHPPLRRVVASPEQVAMGEARHNMEPEEFEAAVAHHYGLL
jgi:NAD(P)-dependent dehydrogenase (short-subunit alcohol dehydrogenase family)